MFDWKHLTADHRTHVMHTRQTLTKYYSVNSVKISILSKISSLKTKIALRKQSLKPKTSMPKVLLRLLNWERF